MRLLITVIFILGFNVFPLPGKAQERFTRVIFATADEGQIEAALFKAESGKVVIFAHGAVFDKESWYFLAERLQTLKIASLALDFGGYGNSQAGKTGQKAYDILGAIAYLEREGCREINIVGGSMGGAAILKALPEVNTEISKVVLLAPAGGPPMQSATIEKLFIVASGEGGYARVTSLYKASAKPKTLQEFAGRAHAQHMFKEDYAAALSQLIIDFLRRD